MTRAFALTTAVIIGLVACDTQSSTGIGSLGFDFVRAFNQEPNAEPLDASELTLALTPRKEPFNP